MYFRTLLGIALLASGASFAQTPKNFDAAAAFGARVSVSDLRLSPDGKSVAYIVPREGQGMALVTRDLAAAAQPVVVANINGKPDRLIGCTWVANDRLVCTAYGVTRNGADLLPFTRVVAIDRSTGAAKMLSNEATPYTHGYLLNGGHIIDWLPEEDGNVLMSRPYVANDHLGTQLGNVREGLGVDWINTRTMVTKTVQNASRDAVGYVTDGHGKVRIVGREQVVQGSQSSGIITFSYRKPDGGDWQKLSDYNVLQREGFYPLAVDRDLNIAYGFKKTDGRLAAYSVTLDGNTQEQLLFAAPDVDVDGLVRMGRRQRVVGVSYSTDYTHVHYFDPALEKLMAALRRALPGQSVDIVDSSLDENILLVIAGSDSDPGVYYVFNRQTKELHTFLVVRAELEGVKLAKVKPVNVPASDGSTIPGYLTLPPGVEQAKGLPAIVMPHGGPYARDYWGFDWLPQYYASRGFVVLQPNFRGSAGYGDAWLQNNGFKSWRTSIGDVLDAGHWLVSQGMADPQKIGVVGWSYGGYAALQSAVVEPNFFKAVIAIAPVTDLDQVKEESRNWSNYNLVKSEIGDGAHIREGSPAKNAEKIKAPVLMFHGANDRNVGILQSKTMDSRLASAGVKHELVTFDDLDHQLEDSAARAQMLRKSDGFLRQEMGLPP